MRGGIITIVGFIFIILVLAFAFAMMTCTTPNSQGTPVCEAMSPLLSFLKSLGF
ncbi:MAG: hypothetical protein JW789_01700 [Candidatus Aenigmarchaeota archaeon]|nr:hypothetical protein [Candidatus Aenigmarchaeota archaeon]